MRFEYGIGDGHRDGTPVLAEMNLGEWMMGNCRDGITYQRKAASAVTLAVC